LTVMLTAAKENVLKEFLNIQALSQFLGIKVSTLYAMVEERKVPYYRIGRLIRFKKSEIDLWLEGQRKACADVNKETRRILKTIERPGKDINQIVRKVIDGAKGEEYNFPHGKPDQVKGLGKEVHDGSV